MDAVEFHTNLGMFIGTEGVYRHWMCRKFFYTQGVKYLVENGAAWLVDAVASYYTGKKLQDAMKKDDMLAGLQIWLLKPTKDNRAVLRCQADTGGNDKVYIEQKIPYTDFPFEGKETFKLYVSHTEVGDEVGWMCMLPSEY